MKKKKQKNKKTNPPSPPPKKKQLLYYVTVKNIEEKSGLCKTAKYKTDHVIWHAKYMFRKVNDVLTLSTQIWNIDGEDMTYFPVSEYSKVLSRYYISN